MWMDGGNLQLHFQHGVIERRPEAARAQSARSPQHRSPSCLTGLCSVNPSGSRCLLVIKRRSGTLTPLFSCTAACFLGLQTAAHFLEGKEKECSCQEGIPPCKKEDEYSYKKRVVLSACSLFSLD